MELPSFDSTDALAWIARAEQYFLVYSTPLDHRVQVALIALSGPAMSWIQILLRRSPLLTWDQFSRELLIRFGTSSAMDGYEALRTTSQVGSLDDYIAAFESRLAQLPDLSDQQYLGFFLGGLKPHIRMQIKDPNITSYATAIQLAKRIDFLVAPATVASRPYSMNQSRAHTHSQQLALSAPSTGQRPYHPNTGTGPVQIGPQNTRRFRNISNEEFRKHVAAGTCFKCGLKFGPTHRCPPKTLQVLVGEDEEEAGEVFHEVLGEDMVESDLLEQADVQHLHLSKMSSNGFDGFQTMKMIGHVGTCRVKVMIDSGASHCFITEAAAHALQLDIAPTDTFSVILGDGSKVRAGGVCLAVPLRLGSQKFSISCYVFPLTNIDIILGVSWLAQLGEVKANWQNLTMEFMLNGRAVRLRGDPTLTQRACTFSELGLLDASDSCWLLWTMENIPDADQFGLADSLSAEARRDILQVASEFPLVTANTTNLPPH